MEDKKNHFCENCGEELSKDDKFCPNSGKSKGSRRNKVIIGVIVLIVIVAIISGVLLSGLGSQIDSTISPTKEVFPNPVEIEGVTFHIPDGYEYISDAPNPRADEISVAGFMNSDSSMMMIAHFLHMSVDEAQNNAINNGYKPIKTTIGEYSGFKYTSNGVSTFIFMKNGEVFGVSVESHLNDEYISKIIS